jgi:hypothetical protein
VTTPHEHQASKNAHQVIAKTLAGLPTRYRISHLIASMLFEDKAALSVQFLVEIATIMARRLPADQQTAVRWHLQNAIEELQAKWH